MGSRQMQISSEMALKYAYRPRISSLIASTWTKTLLRSLPVRPTPRSHETLFSLLSRTAAMRGLSTWELTAELGLSQKPLIAVEDASVDQLSELFGLNPAESAALVSWTPQPLEGVRMQFRGEPVVSRAVMNPTVRGCPRCLREDTNRSEFATVDGMVMRGDWQFRHVVICVSHASPLVPLWTVKRIADRCDYATHLSKIENDLMEGRLDVATCEVTEYDKWIDQRLETGRDETWLANHSVDVAAQFCELLGAELVRRDLAPRAVGFEVASQGPKSIERAFHVLAKRASGPQDEMRSAFGRMYDWLASTAANDPRYDPFRSLLREVALDIWAVSPGTKVLGHRLKARRMHSVLTSATDAGVSPARMRSLLVSEGVICVDDDRSDARLTFPLAKVEGLMNVFEQLVGSKEMQRRLGCGEQQLEALVEAGILTPRFPPDVTRRPWNPADAEAFLERLYALAQDIPTEDQEWEQVHRASVRCRVKIDKVLKPIWDGALAVGRRRDLRGYASVFVRRSEVDVLVRPERPDHRTLSEFASEVGLNKHREFRLLVDHGHTPVTVIYNPQTHRRDHYVTEDDAAAFHARFTTLKLLSTRLGQSSRSISQRLKAAGIERFQPSDIDFGPVYFLEDVAPLLLRIKPRDLVSKSN
ncbi:TniQ family protein [Gymnodinialimonas ulvae]|uniref:TniQ family protein n=1 Tax=Gymnodinialimonas ulvae TaxID=3126504 RepID=UPI0030ADA9DA